MSFDVLTKVKNATKEKEEAEKIGYTGFVPLGYTEADVASTPTKKSSRKKSSSSKKSESKEKQGMR